MRTAGLRRSGIAGALLLLLAALADEAPADTRLGVETFQLANGMRFLLLQRPSMPTVEAGWVVSVGSADDPADATGMSHFIEHMMFKGSRTVGTVDIERELPLLAELAALEETLAEPATSPRARRRRAELESRREALQREADALTRLGAFSFEYSRIGATRLNANTSADLTLYYVTLPAEALELWFWLESDRLSEPVFREFSKEKQVVAEERRQRVASQPTGAADLEFERAFWGPLPYAQPPMGSIEHVDRLTPGRLEDFFARHYRPERLTAVLVGNFEPRRAKELATAYFSRLESRPDDESAPPPTSVAAGQKTLELSCRCAPRVRVRYPTVAFGHPDQYALQVLAGVFNGRSGRLYRNLVLGSEVAFAAYARQTPLRRGGHFEVTLESKGGVSGDELLAAWDRELERLRSSPPTADEIARVQRRLATENLDQLKDPHLLMRRLLVYAGLGDWRQLPQWTDRIRAVDATAVAAAAERHLDADRRLVGFYRRLGEGR